MSPKKILNTILFSILSLSILIDSSFALAANKYDQISVDGLDFTSSAETDIASKGGLNTATSVPQMVGNIIKIVLGLSGTAALIFVIWGGIKWMISKGDEKKITDARKLMTSGMIGIAIIAAAYAITDFVIKQITVVAA